MAQARLLILGVFVLASIAAGGVFLQEAVRASHQPTQPGVIDRVLIDADTSTAGAVDGVLGVVEGCKDGVGIGEPVAVDVILDGIDPTDGSLDGGGGVNVGIRFDDSRLDFVSIEAIGPLAGAGVVSGVVDVVDGTFSRLRGYSVIRQPGDGPEFSRAQLWARVNFIAQADGVARVYLEDVPGRDGSRDFVAAMSGPGSGLPMKLFDLNDDNGDGFSLSSFVDGELRIGGLIDCASAVDTDSDGVFDSLDNCIYDPNGPGQAGEAGIGDQTNTDSDLSDAGATINSGPLPSDAAGDACDDDDDNDSTNGVVLLTQTPGAAATGCPGGSVPVWADCVESYLGTTIGDSCTGLPGASGDAWPPDVDGSGSVGPGDVFAMLDFFLTSSPRHDLNADGVVTAGDVFAIFPWWLADCT